MKQADSPNPRTYIVENDTVMEWRKSVQKGNKWTFSNCTLLTEDSWVEHKICQIAAIPDK